MSGLVLKRDIYYTLNPGQSDFGNLWDERDPRNAIELFDNLADPAHFAFLKQLQPKDYPIGPDRFLMLGDNSPMSRDSRGWRNEDRYDPDDPERGFALILDRGGMRRAWLRGRENLHKRYLIHVAGYNLGLIMRLLTGAGTPREFAARASAWIGTIPMPDGGLTAVLLLAVEDQIAVLVVSIQADPLG